MVMRESVYLEDGSVGGASPTAGADRARPGHDWEITEIDENPPVRDILAVPAGFDEREAFPTGKQ